MNEVGVHGVRSIDMLIYYETIMLYYIQYETIQ
jgi:hypothetical protein